MFHLWCLVEQDLLSENVPYRLRDTGQGLNRVQSAPKTSRMMQTILHNAQKSVGTWIGSSVIHMGDHNVPNALLFIDKYTQIYRILLPICNTLSQIPILVKNPLFSHISRKSLTRSTTASKKFWEISSVLDLMYLGQTIYSMLGVA